MFVDSLFCFCCFFFVASNFLRLLFVVISGNGQREGDRVRAELNALGDPATRAKNPLWADRDKAQVFATLRERVRQVPRFADFCGKVLR